MTNEVPNPVPQKKRGRPPKDRSVPGSTVADLQRKAAVHAALEALDAIVRATSEPNTRELAAFARKQLAPENQNAA